MVRAHSVWLTLFCQLVLWSAAVAGPFNNIGIPKDDPAITQWAATVIDYRPAPCVTAAFAISANALGPANGSIVSLGDLNAQQIGENVPPGALTLAFNAPIMNGPGWDLLVFENAGTFFPPPFVFAELAYVEVSTNGVDFARFPSAALNVEPGQGRPGDTEINTAFGRAFAGINTTNVNNLAGIHPSNIGTQFNLDDLTAAPLVQNGSVDLNAVRYVRLVDIPGSGDFADSQGRPILDAWVTAGSGGLDLDAVGARYAVPEPSSIALLAVALASLAFALFRQHGLERPRATWLAGPGSARFVFCDGCATLKGDHAVCAGCRTPARTSNRRNERTYFALHLSKEPPWLTEFARPATWNHPRREDCSGHE